MAVEVRGKMSPALYNKMGQRVREENLTESEYIVNLITDNLFPELLENHVDVKEFDPFEWLNNNQFTSEAIADLFMILVRKMSTKEKVMVQKLLKHFELIDSKENKDGIHTLPKEHSQRQVYKLDSEDVSAKAAEQVIEDQLYEIEDNDVDEIEDEIDDEYTEKEYDEEINYEDDLSIDLDQETKPIIHELSNKEIEKISMKKQIEQALDGNVEETMLDDDNDDPDQDVPGWADEDPAEVEEKAVGVDESASEKVINNAPGLSAPVKPKKAKKLEYDPKLANRASTIIGPYAHDTRRTKTPPTQREAAHGANLLKNMGVSTETIRSTIRSR